MSSKLSGAGETAQLSNINPWLTSVPLMLAVFIYVLDSTIANVALPYMAGSFTITRDESMWIVTSYIIACGIMVPMVDWFCRVLGRKTYFIISILVFTSASVLCGLAHNIEFMLFALILQGAGGGGILPVAQAIMLEIFKPEERQKSMAVFGLGVICAPIVGPFLGGWITDNWSWHWIFYINLPVGIIAAILAKNILFDPPYAQKKKNTKLDWFGFFALAIWMITLQIVLDKGNNEDWFNSEWIRNIAIISLISAFLFFWSQLKTKKTLIDLYVFRDKNFAMGTFIQVILQGVLYGSLILLPQFLQGMLRYNAYLSGLATMPRGMGSFVSMILCGAISSRVDGRVITSFGLVLIGTASLMMGNLSLNIASMNIVLPNIIMGLGLGFAMTPLMSMTVQTLKNKQMTNASGLGNLLKTIGGAIGTSLVATMLTRRAQMHQHYMVEHLNPLNPVFAERMQTMTGAFSSIAHSSVAQEMAAKTMYSQLLQQATLVSFMDAFKIIGVVCFMVIPLVFLMKPVGKGGKIDMASAGH
jgi:DHA2 family multidrug resistance protein